MGNSYSVNASVACGTDLPIINITGSASIVVKVYEWIMGFPAVADVATKFMFERTTGVGTGGTALTENKVDPLTVAASGAAVKGTYTTAPVDADELMLVTINSRATHRWIAREGHEFRSTAAASNGIMLNSESSTGTPNVDATIYWME